MASRAATAAPVPPRRPARRGAVPAHAAARPARRDPRLRRARAVRDPLPAAVGAAGALGGHVLRAKASDNRARTLRIDAPRGAILDRNGRVLVRNTLGTSLEVWPADLPKNRAVARARAGAPRRPSSACRSTKLEQRIREGADEPLTPVVIRRGLHDDQITYIQERKLQFPGVQLGDSYLRKYPHRSLGAHFLGHVGEINADELKARKGDGYKLGDVVGQAGVEDDLRHVPPRHRRLRAASPSTRAAARRAPGSRASSRAPGSTLRLTIDLQLQRAAEQALRDGIAFARETPEGWAADGGAVVALDPRDGAVLALASYPTFEPSVYVNRDARQAGARSRTRSVALEQRYPGLNRALAVGYPPGSTWKPVTALAAMQEHVLTPYSSHPCTPDFEALRSGLQRTGTRTPAAGSSCPPRSPSRATPTSTKWVSTSTTCPRTAVTRSRTGPRASASARRPGIDVGPEAAGLLPTPEWRRADVRRTAVHARSIEPGSRATRSRWRSARATSSSRRSR